MFNCKWTHGVLGLAILVVTLWPNLIGAMASKWVVIIAALIVLVHACACKNCSCGAMGKEMPKKRRR